MIDSDKLRLSELVVLHFGPVIDGRTKESRFPRNVPLIQKAIEKDSEDGYLHFVLANEFFQVNEFNLALVEYQSSVDLEGGDTTWLPAAFRNLGWCAMQSQDYSAAISHLKDGLEKYPDSTDLVFAMRQVYLRAGERGVAVQLFQDCLLMGDPKAYDPSWGRTGTALPQTAISQLTR